MTTETQKHTPTPWEWDAPLCSADLDKNAQAMIRLSCVNTCEAVLMVGAGLSYLVLDNELSNGVLRAYAEIKPADAEFIVLACNCHDELVEAATGVINAVGAWHLGESKHLDAIIDAAAILDAVLAKAAP